MSWSFLFPRSIHWATVLLSNAGASAGSFSYSMDENWPGRFVMTSPLKMKKKKKKKNFAWDVHNREIIEWRMMTLLLKGYQRNVKNAVNKRIVQRMNPCIAMYVD